MRIGLSLSGGGARGAAHIGVLRAFMEAGIKVDEIAGVSAGAIVGAMAAGGLSPDQMQEAISDISLRELYRLSLPDMGMIDLQNLSQWLAAVLPVHTFEALSVPLHVGVTNLNSGEPHVFARGDLIGAVAASCAIPFFFKPAVIDNVLYSDGGICNNMIVSPLFLNCDFIIGVNVVPLQTIPSQEIDSLVSVMKRTFSISIAANAKYSEERCDYLITPVKSETYGLFQSEHLSALHDLGYVHARGLIPNLNLTYGNKKRRLDNRFGLNIGTLI